MANKRGSHEGSFTRTTNGRWRVSVMIDGHRYSATRDTQRECRDFVREKQTLHSRGFRPSEGKVLVKNYLDEWLKRHSREIKETTVKQYQRRFNSNVYPYIGDVPLAKLTLPMIEKYYDQLLENGVGETVVSLVNRILHKAFADAVRLQTILVNPTNGTTISRSAFHEMKVWDTGQVSQFLMAAHHSEKNIEALYYLALTTGMRSGELRGLKWNDIQWQHSTLNVKRQVQFIESKGMVFTAPKTNAGLRTIRLGENTLTQLRKHFQSHEVMKRQHGEGWNKEGLVFPSPEGHILYSARLREDFYPLVRLAKVPRIRFHDLRHTAASILLMNGVPVIVVSKILGHSSVTVTLRYYAHFIPGINEGATELMDSLVTPVSVALKADYSRLHSDNEEG